MKVLLGLELDGGAYRQRDAGGWLGAPVWGPKAMLRDLRLRLGLVGEVASSGMRVQAWSSRMARALEVHAADGAGAAAEPVYAASYRTDAAGTAAELLRWRDDLKLAGWNGQGLTGSKRLADLSQLEALPQPALPLGYADQVCWVEETLRRELTIDSANREAFRKALAEAFEQLELADVAGLWPARWQDILAHLRAAGSTLSVLEPAWKLAESNSDLGRVQRALNDEQSTDGGPLRGDGSLLILRAATSLELAEAVAALVSQNARRPTLVIRSSDEGALAAALAAGGAPGLGCRSSSKARPALQVLELAFAVSFEPRDPARALELLTCPIGPFAGKVGYKLAAALCESSGVGNEHWQSEKAKLAAEAQQRVAAWFEGPALASDGATREQLLSVAQRVLAWQLKRAKFDDDAGVSAAARAQSAALIRALEGEPAETLDRVALQQLLTDVASTEVDLAVLPEQAGRTEHVTAPAQLFTSAERVVWWGFASAERAPRFRWRAAELVALQEQGVRFVEPTLLVARQMAMARRGVFAANRQLVLATAAQASGSLTTTHPLLDEIIARLGDAERLAPAMRSAAELLGGQSLPGGDVLKVEPLALMPLPATRSLWQLEPQWLTPRAEESASGLESLLGCQLKWVLQYKARLRGGNGYELPTSILLYGRIGHRMAEVLHQRGQLSAAPEKLRAAAELVFDELVESEAAHLLAEGASFEVVQVRRQLSSAMVSLGDVLARQKLTVVGVERKVSATWRGRPLGGRIDLLLTFEDGREAVIDLKWGTAGYRQMLMAGQALQLAVYVGARKEERQAELWPPAAYFSLSRGDLVTTDAESDFGVKPVAGPSIAETWARADRSTIAVEHLLKRGTVLATGLASAPALLDVLKIPDAERDRYLPVDLERACKYCDFGDVCGKKWEAQQ